MSNEGLPRGERYRRVGSRMFGEGMARRRQRREMAANLYVRVVEHARCPEFFDDFGVPDTPEGRFEMIALHAFLVMQRLTEGDEKTKRFSQELFDHMFADMDRNLRELGVGDLSVGKKIKALARSFYGRTVAYQRGLAEAGDTLLMEGLQRNVYGAAEITTGALPRLASYVRRQADVLTRQPLEDLCKGLVRFDRPEKWLMPQMQADAPRRAPGDGLTPEATGAAETAH